MKLALLLAAAVVALGAPALAQDAAHGKDLYMKLGCYQCHGTLGQGGSYTGPRLAPDPPSLAYMKSYIRHPARDMPPYSEKVLSDAFLADIRAYLLTVPRPPAAKDLPGLGR